MSSKHSYRGFTLVELMIAILIGLFLVGGLLTLVGGMKRTSTTQTGVSQLQDNERMSMTLLADVVQQAGYYYKPTVNTPSLMFPVTGVWTLAGQTVNGCLTCALPAPGETLYVRYASAGGDGVIDCTGNVSPLGTAANYVDQFSLDSNGNLICVLTKNGAVSPPVQLASGITNMTVLYGVPTNAAAGTNSVDTYLPANLVASGGFWSSVISVKITLTFKNPLAGQPSQPLTIPFTRTVVVMNKSGVIT